MNSFFNSIREILHFDKFDVAAFFQAKIVEICTVQTNIMLLKTRKQFEFINSQAIGFSLVRLMSLTIFILLSPKNALFVWRAKFQRKAR